MGSLLQDSGHKFVEYKKLCAIAKHLDALKTLENELTALGEEFIMDPDVFKWNGWIAITQDLRGVTPQSYQGPN